MAHWLELILSDLFDKIPYYLYISLPPSGKIYIIKKSKFRVQRPI